MPPRAIDLTGDAPQGIAGHVYLLVRSHCEFHAKDRPLSAEVEAIEEDLGSDETMAALIAMALLPMPDDFFALAPLAVPAFDETPVTDRNERETQS